MNLKIKNKNLNFNKKKVFALISFLCMILVCTFTINTKLISHADPDPFMQQLYEAYLSDSKIDENDDATMLYNLFNAQFTYLIYPYMDYVTANSISYQNMISDLDDYLHIGYASYDPTVHLKNKHYLDMLNEYLNLQTINDVDDFIDAFFQFNIKLLETDIELEGTGSYSYLDEIKIKFNNFISELTTNYPEYKLLNYVSNVNYYVDKDLLDLGCDYDYDEDDDYYYITYHINESLGSHYGQDDFHDFFPLIAYETDKPVKQTVVEFKIESETMPKDYRLQYDTMINYDNSPLELNRVDNFNYSYHTIYESNMFDIYNSYGWLPYRINALNNSKYYMGNINLLPYYETDFYPYDIKVRIKKHRTIEVYTNNIVVINPSDTANGRADVPNSKVELNELLSDDDYSVYDIELSDIVNNKIFLGLYVMNSNHTNECNIEIKYMGDDASEAEDKYILDAYDCWYALGESDFNDSNPKTILWKTGNYYVNLQFKIDPDIITSNPGPYKFQIKIPKGDTYNLENPILLTHDDGSYIYNDNTGITKFIISESGNLRLKPVVTKTVFYYHNPDELVIPVSKLNLADAKSNSKLNASAIPNQTLVNNEVANPDSLLVLTYENNVGTQFTLEKGKDYSYTITYDDSTNTGKYTVTGINSCEGEIEVQFTYTKGGTGGGGGSSSGGSRKKDKPKEEPKPVEPEKPKTEKHNNKSYMNGYDDKTFKPNSNITRAEVATILARLDELFNESNNYIDYTNKYIDLSLYKDWYSNYIGFVSKENILEGWDDNFYPNENMTRGQFAHAMVKMFDLKADKKDNKLIDINGRWYEDDVIIMTSLGYIDGYNDNTFKGNQGITRAEACKIINRITNKYLLDSKTINDDQKSKIKNSFNDIFESDWYYYDVVSAASNFDYEVEIENK